MLAKQLFEEGKVRDAQAALSEWLRRNPNDDSQRIFLFELLCFSGDWDRAQRQLTVLAQGTEERKMGAALYLAALEAERTRQNMRAGETASSDADAPATFSGTLNRQRFQNISDIDPHIGRRLEIFAAGSYAFLAFEHIESLRIEPLRKLRDLLWVPASIRMNASCGEGREIEALLPAIYPFTWRVEDESVWLGRATCWVADDERPRPAGQKMLLVDDTEVPLLEIRELCFDRVPEAAHA